MNLSIVSFDCRGLGDIQKGCFELYKARICPSVYFTIHTSLMMSTNRLRSFWGFEIFILPAKSNARGTAILFNNNIEYAILHQHRDEDDNLLILEIITFNKYDFMLVNI